MDPLFNMFKIRFTILDNIISSNNDIKPDDKINVFINVESILKLFMNIKMEEYLRVSNEERVLEFISNLINLAAHYRLYFSKNKLYSRVYLIMPNILSERFNNRVFNDNYRTFISKKYAQDVNFTSCRYTVKEGLRFAKVITEYIEGVYIIESEHIESSVVPMIISEEDKSYKNMLVTTDPYDYQYSNHGFYVLRPKKAESFLIKGNIINTIRRENKIKNTIIVNELFYSFILSIIGDKFRGIPNIKNMGLSKTLSQIEKGVKIGRIPDGANNIRLLLDIIKSEDDRLQILNNFFSMDVAFQCESLTTKDKYNILNQINDKFDIESLRDINDKYFISTPINILEVTSGTKYKEDK